MTWQTALSITSLLITIAVMGFLALYAWRQRETASARAFMWLALSECYLALAEVLSMLGQTQAQALFWFNTRFLSLATVPILWLIFVLEYSGRKHWLSKLLMAGMFVIPILTQIMIWSNGLHGLWVEQEVGFHQDGPFWIAATSARIPGAWFLVHSLYGYIFLMTGVVLIFIVAWQKRKLLRAQALLLAFGALITILTSLIPTLNLNPGAEFNPFAQSMGLSALLIAAAIFRFQFLKKMPGFETDPKARELEIREKRSLALLVFIFALLVTGIITTGYLVYQKYERDFRDQVEKQISSISNLKVDELCDWRNERLGDAEVLHQNPVFVDLVLRFFENPADAQAQAELQAWLEGIQSNYKYDRILLLDARGVERISAPASFEPVSEYLVDQIAGALISGQVTFLDFYRETAGGSIHLALLIPFVDAHNDNRPLGVLVLRIDPNAYLYPFIQRWPTPSESAETLLVRREGNDTLFLNDSRFLPGTALTLRIPLEKTEILSVKATLGYEGVVEGLDYRGVPVVGVVRAVPDSPWFLVARMDTAEVYAPMRNELWQIILLVGTLIIGIGSIIGLLARTQRVRFYRMQYEAAKAVRILSSRQEAILTSVPNIIMEVDEHSVYTWANQPGMAFFGEDVIGKEASFYFLGEQHTYRAVQPLFDGNEDTLYVESWQRRKDGQKRLLAWWCRVLKDESGRVTGALSSAIDITERRQEEDTLREHEQRLASIYATAGDVIFYLAVEPNERYRFVSVNPAFYKITGLPNAEVIGKVVHEVIPEPSLSLVLTNYRKAIAEKAVVRWEETTDYPAGQLIGEVSVAPVFDENEHCTHLVGTVHNVTERKRAEEALRDSRRMLQTVLDAIPSAVFWKDRNLNYLGGNHTWLETVGLKTADEVVGKSDYDLPWGKKEADSYREYDRRVMDSGVPENDIIEPYRQADGTRAWAKTNKMPLRDTEGNIIGILGTYEDITERKQAEEEIRRLNTELEQRVRDRTAQLENTNQELEAFTYSVSHDLRAPLRGIDGWSMALLEEYNDALDEKGRQYLHRVRSETQHMGQLIDDLLQLSHVTRSTMQKQDVDLTAIAHSIAARLQETQPQRQISFLIQPGMVAKGDARLLEIALTNLLDNACKFTGTLAVAHIEFGQAGEENQKAFFVRDDGVGFDMTYADKLFGVFQRLHKASEFPGTGVGLATVQRIVYRHGGRVWAEAAVGKGATFHFTLAEEA
jgi:PAS domain S-box-containing protein